MSIATLEVNTACRTASNGPAELAAVLLAESASLRAPKGETADRSYVAALNHLALSRLHTALLVYQANDAPAILRCAESVETHRHLPAMMRDHLAPALRAVAADGLPSFVAAELVTACITAEARDDVLEYFAEVGASGFADLAAAVEDLAESMKARH